MSEHDDTTLGDDLRDEHAYACEHAADPTESLLGFAARADALTAALREARAERHDMAIRLGEANRRTNRADAEVDRQARIIAGTKGWGKRADEAVAAAEAEAEQRSEEIERLREALRVQAEETVTAAKSSPASLQELQFNAVADALEQERRRAERAEAEVERLRPATCDMKHAEPFNFAWCETHDTIFPLGKSCRFDGRDVTEVFGEDADTQRQRAVMAEMERDRLAAEVNETRKRAERSDAEVERLRHINVDLTNAGMDETERADRLAAQVEAVRPVIESLAEAVKWHDLMEDNPADVRASEGWRDVMDWVDELRAALDPGKDQKEDHD